MSELAQNSAVSDLYNRHRDESCFIVGSGSSLLQDMEHLGRLQDRLTFVPSRLVLWKDIPFTPTYHLLAELVHINHRGTYYWPGVQERFLVTHRNINEEEWTYVPKADNAYYVLQHGLKGLGKKFEPFTNGRSAVCTALQLAMWMGCTTAYLLGCELTNTGHAWDVDDARNDVSLGHKLDAWKRAAADMKKAGRTLIDCTIDGNLSKHGVVDYMPLKDALDAT